LYRLADQRPGAALSRSTGGNCRDSSAFTAAASPRANGGLCHRFPSRHGDFSIFRHTAEQPLFAIAKVPPGATQGGYMVTTDRASWRTGDSLEDVLTIFERKLRLLRG